MFMKNQLIFLFAISVMIIPIYMNETNNRSAIRNLGKAPFTSNNLGFQAGYYDVSKTSEEEQGQEPEK